MKNTLCYLVCGLLPAGVAQGASFDSGLLAGGLIPDNGSTAFTWSRSGPPALITSVTVSLSISGVGTGGAFNGDLYASLQHTDGARTAAPILLNRPGRPDAGAFGYGDNGLSVTFDDNVGAPDVHNYRLTLSGDPLMPLGGPLTGTWESDGRAVDPATVAAGSPRTTSLRDFWGMDPNGTWLLYLADMSPGGNARLDSWRIVINAREIVIPEPAGMACLVALGLAGFALIRRTRLEP